MRAWVMRAVLGGLAVLAVALTLGGPILATSQGNPSIAPDESATPAADVGPRLDPERGGGPILREAAEAPPPAEPAGDPAGVTAAARADDAAPVPLPAEGPQ